MALGNFRCHKPKKRVELCKSVELQQNSKDTENQSFHIHNLEDKFKRFIFLMQSSRGN